MFKCFGATPPIPQSVKCLYPSSVCRMLSATQWTLDSHGIGGVLVPKRVFFQLSPKWENYLFMNLLLLLRTPLNLINKVLPITLLYGIGRSNTVK